MADVYYHIERPGPRSRYILAHLLGGMTGWHAEEVPRLDIFRSISGPKLIYGSAPVEGALAVVPEGLLEQQGHRHEPWELAVEAGLPHDLFSAAFFLLSRMEEYGPIGRDEHGRPLTSVLHAARHGFLERPVVDEWLQAVVARWRGKDPRLPPLRRSYSHTATMDADNGAMFLGRPWWRTWGSTVRDLLKGRPGRVLDRFAVLAGTKQDPYAVHGPFVELARTNQAGAIINFIAARRGRFDHAIPLGDPYMSAVVHRAVQQGGIGLHPSYASSDAPARFDTEKAWLEAVSGQPVRRSRQHYLRMQLPGTMRALEGLGIREEHSMGLADGVGFRAGTCTPFPFFDLIADEQSTLMVHPFAIMDSAMAYKLKLSPEQAILKANQLVDAVRAVEGTFISVWHERFLSDYGDEAGWGRVAREVLAYARP
ncbi:MAG: polysaccharide deacetylase family protein [Flavobacteriales bacterium]|nr:polysaccharide deacetylase family protein [Flavobacteriales bacterium]